MDLLELRRQIGAIDGSLKKESFGFSFLNGALPRGAVVEVAGHGKTELALRFLQEHPELRVAWLEKEFSLFPVSIWQKQVHLNRLLFVETGTECAWAALQILQSQLFPVVTLSQMSFDEKTLRKIQLCAEKSQSSVLWLSQNLQRSWVSSLQLQTYRSPSGKLDVVVMKKRGML